MTMPGGPAAPLRLVAGVVLTPAERAVLEDAGVRVLADATAPPERRERAARSATVWFGPGLDARLLAGAPELRWWQSDTVGLDHYLFPEIADSPVVVTAVRGKHVSASEQAMALVLALARGLPELARRQARHEWRPVAQDEVRRLSGARMVVLGTGQIGGDVAVRAAAFGLEVDGVNLDGSPAPGFRRVWPAGEVEDAVDGADWVVCALPMTAATAGLVSARVIGRMGPSAVFVNVGRGGVVDQDALRAALAGGRLAAAGLDVFASEPLPDDDGLWDLPNVVVTPHSAGLIAGLPGHRAGVEFLLDNVARLRRGEPLAGVVDKRAGF